MPASKKQLPTQQWQFETANFDSWQTKDCPNNSNFVEPQVTDLSGYSPGFGFQDISVPEGVNIMMMGIDGEAGCEVSLCQTISIPDTLECAVLRWSEIFEWVYSSPVSSSEEKVFALNVIDTATGVILDVLHSIRLDGSIQMPNASPAQSVNGWLEMNADLSAFIGQTIELCYTGTVPTAFSGPALLQLDNVALLQNAAAAPPPPPPPLSTVDIPTMSQWGLFLFGLSLFTLCVVVLWNIQQSLGNLLNER